ncbi:helix-turn-helix domain-containing protein [Noviherbaspirillum saxi]|uniref:DNA-binding transcriptional regulator n=1 Tax=Noviherbaspirillum saxi TaxID=2320863 RepID=A0A3A3FVY5_9BURK|nr:DNA-binding transcriptional regulator [Noviherbaspirillum saxi]RJF99484.1 DNA-binding transcriptional regulator [Noviherbaspirillum saxi]
MTANNFKTKPKSDAFEAIHSAATGLHRAGVIDQKTMREFDEACLTKVPVYASKDVKRIRRKVHVSQAVFAAYMNTSVSTVQKWETGGKTPSGPAAKLLNIVEKHGLEVLA